LSSKKIKKKKKSIALHSIYQVLDVIKIDSNLNSATITAQSCLKLE